MKFLHSKLNDDVCFHIYEYMDNYRQYFQGVVLPLMIKTVRDNMIQRMWHIMYCTGKTTTEGIRNLRRFLMSDGFDFELLKNDSDFIFVDGLYFNHEIMRHLLKKRH